MIFVQDEIGRHRLFPGGRDAARGHGTLGREEHIAASLDVPRPQSVVQQNRLQFALSFDRLVVRGNVHQLVRDSIGSGGLRREQSGVPFVGLPVPADRFWVAYAVRKVPWSLVETAHLIGTG